MHTNTKVWVEGTIMAAFAMALSFIPVDIGASFSLSLGQIPLTIFALRRGVKPAIAAGFIWGMLHLFLGKAYFLMVSQVIIEYPLAFAFAGFAGIVAIPFRKAVQEGDLKKVRTYLILGSLAGAVARWFWHFVAGVIFWGEYAQWGMSPVTFSFVANGISGLATGVTTAGALLVIYQLSPFLFSPKEERVAKLS